MKNKATNYKIFLSLLGVLLFIGIIILTQINKGDFVLWSNNHRTLLSNYFFIISSMLVEVEIMLFVLAILLWKRRGTAFLVALAWGVSGVTAQSLKRVFQLPRPATFFENTETLHFITEKISYHLSFPSGHTTTAFAIFGMIAFCSQKKWMQPLCFLLALAVGLSRVYLLQHFFIDILAGAVLGTSISFLLYNAMEKYTIFGFEKWKDKSLL